MRALATATLLGAVVLGGCAGRPGPGSSTYFECDRGTRLQVTYRGPVALVRAAGGPAIALRATPAVDGQVFEARGYRLHVRAGTATWNGPGRSAPESCRSVAVPR